MGKFSLVLHFSHYLPYTFFLLQISLAFLIITSNTTLADAILTYYLEEMISVTSTYFALQPPRSCQKWLNLDNISQYLY